MAHRDHVKRLRWALTASAAMSLLGAAFLVAQSGTVIVVLANATTDSPLVLVIGGRSYGIHPQAAAVGSNSGLLEHSVRVLTHDCSEVAAFSAKAGERYFVTVNPDMSAAVERVGGVELGPAAAEFAAPPCALSGTPPEIALRNALIVLAAATGAAVVLLRRKARPRNPVATRSESSFAK